MTLGLVCDSCDALSPLNASVCQACGVSFGIVDSLNFAAKLQMFFKAEHDVISPIGVQSSRPGRRGAIEKPGALSRNSVNGRQQATELKQQRFGQSLGFRIFETSQGLAARFFD